jgi:hypothetical protein
MPEIEMELAISPTSTASFNSLADVFRQIGHDERVPKKKASLR